MDQGKRAERARSAGATRIDKPVTLVTSACRPFNPYPEKIDDGLPFKKFCLGVAYKGRPRVNGDWMIRQGNVSWLVPMMSTTSLLYFRSYNNSQGKRLITYSVCSILTYIKRGWDLCSSLGLVTSKLTLSRASLASTDLELKFVK